MSLDKTEDGISGKWKTELTETLNDCIKRGRMDFKPEDLKKIYKQGRCWRDEKWIITGFKEKYC